MSDRPKIGDYVLATKYNDGDPRDHFYIGFVSGYTHHGRFLVEDSQGVNQRGNGFRRAERITGDEGAKLVAMIPEIGDIPGRSLWWHLARIRGEGNVSEPTPFTYYVRCEGRFVSRATNGIMLDRIVRDAISRDWSIDIVVVPGGLSIEGACVTGEAEAWKKLMEPENPVDTQSTSD